MTTPQFWSPAHSPWLGQGDLFLTAPLVATQTNGSAVTSEIILAPALLASHDCALDKVNARGVMQATHVTFLPLRSLTVLEGNRANIVRSNNVTPYDFFFVGVLPGLGESYLSLNTPSTVTLDYFEPELRMFPGDSEAHLVAQRNDTRIGTLSSAQLELFRTKWNVYWTRRLPQPT